MFNKYFSLFLILLSLSLLSYALMLKRDRDLKQNKINELIADNKDLKSTIIELENNNKKDKERIKLLEIKRKEREDEAIKLKQNFHKLKNENKSINAWANSLLPNGLY